MTYRLGFVLINSIMPSDIDRLRDLEEQIAVMSSVISQQVVVIQQLLNAVEMIGDVMFDNEEVEFYALH